MAHITIEEHLVSMTNEKPEPWLIELGQMLQELQDIDSALAASLAYDLSRIPKAAQALRELIHGYLVIKEELNQDNLTSIQNKSIKMAIDRISRDLHDLTIQHSKSSSFMTKEKINHGK